MPRPPDIDETASRADDKKPQGLHDDIRGGNVTDGKDEDTPQGGKRRGPGRWVDPQSTGG